MNDVLKREVEHSYIPQDVQAAIDTILSWGYSVNLENQILRSRLDEVRRLIDAGAIAEVEAATHDNTALTESARIRRIILEEESRHEREDEQ